MTRTATNDDTVQIHYRSVEVDGVRVFYREAGASAAPALLLLHGFPSSSHQFRDLIRHLADSFHLIAPDLPGFGFTEVPRERGYLYSFDNLAKTMTAFVDALDLDRFAMYVFDFGAPVGFRMALTRPQSVVALISQNGNAYEEGLTEGWEPIRAYWSDPSPENRQSLHDAFLHMAGTRWQYVHGVAEPDLIAPESYTLDALLLERPGVKDAMLDLILDYRTNVALYPRFQTWLRENLPTTLAIWGSNDPFFAPPGAEAFRQDVPDAVVELLDTGHFALETHAARVAKRIREIILPALSQ